MMPPDREIADRIEKIKYNMQGVLSMSEAEADVFFGNMVVRKFNKGDMILQTGKVERYLSLVALGLTRHFVLTKAGEEFSFDFSFEYEFNSSYASFIQQQPSLFAIEALEDTVLLSLSYNFLDELYNKYPQSNKFGRIAIEQYYIWREKREVALLTENATERYRKLLEQHPEYVHKIPQKYLATYLNVKPESLSRIRKNIFNSRA